MWYKDVFKKRLSGFLTMMPSEYMARNLRVTPFNNFEPVEVHLARFPQLQDCYCYSTDYPHIEGGTQINRKFYEQIAHLGTSVLEKFFVTNANLLLPD
jgi:predicted TIM-barrel fold metal-dependent hydrolase